jgi:hypothetical protein
MFGLNLIKFIFAFIFLFLINVHGAATYTSGATAAQLAAQIQGTGITISNPKITAGQSNQAGIFSNGIAGAGLEVDSGIILTTMDVATAFQANSNTHTSKTHVNYKDKDLTAIDGSSYYDTIIFEFDVILDANTRLLMVDYQFASEEYNEWVGSQFNDAFGFFISGGDLNKTYNIARVVDDSTIVTTENIAKYDTVTVNNVNRGTVGSENSGAAVKLTNSKYFIDNCYLPASKRDTYYDCTQTASKVTTEFDGLTHRLHASIDNLTPGLKYHFKMAIADTADAQWDTGVFVKTINGLRSPQMCYDYSVKQDGQYLLLNSTIPRIDTKISKSPLEVTVYLRDSDTEISAQGISLFTDLNTSLFDYDMSKSIYVSNSNASVLEDRGIPTKSGTLCSYNIASGNAITDIGCTDGHNIRKGLGSLGQNQYLYTQFFLAPKISSTIEDINTSLNLKLNDYIVVNGTQYPSSVLYFGGSNIPLCPPTKGYQPAWGTFNVVDHYASSVNELPANNLRTQVSRKPFEVDVATYEKNTDGKYTKKPTIDMNTTVVVEVIDNDAFHDVNASCANPGSVITPPIYVGIANTSKDMTIDIPKQDIAYHNFAVKNAAYRVWYFDQNQSLINWNAYTSDSTRRNLTSISGLYKSGYHTVCTSACASPASINCFNCIKTNYAKPLCSRDNFAVRPESYDLRIYDINQSLSQASALKDSTKVNLSGLYHYTPDYNSATGRINVAAGYNYRYDINATGNDTNLTKVPGYTRYFSGARNDYNATMIWEPDVGHITTGCNDRSGKNLNFYVANGQMLNTEQNQTQVGEYRLNIIDPAWTAVDWDSTLTTHHTNSNGFEATKEDCIVGTDTTTASEGKIGCTTTSAHSGGGYTYKDHLLRLKPAKFDLSSIAYGIGKIPLAITTGGAGFVYDSDLNVTNDMAMSVRSYGPLKAVGYGGETLSNFVTQCYATDLNVSISHDANTSIPFSGRMTVAEIGGTQIFDSLKFNAKKSALQTIDDTYFHKIDNGQTVPTIRLNFDRNSTTPILPQIVQYGDFNVSCAIPSDCNMSAMSNSVPNTAKGYKVMDFSVTHTYGRLIARDIKATWMQPFNEIGKYEVYKTSNLIGTALSPDQFDADWYVNVLHTDANYGDASVTVIDPSNGASLPTESNSLNGVKTFAFPTFTIKQGYRGHIDTEGWLWYGGVNALPYADPNGPAQAGTDNLSCLTHPCFGISLGRIIGNTGSAKTESEANKANKKTTSTGWSTTSEYAPAVR